MQDLRRTWARQAWEAGVSIEDICTILGHRDTKTTYRYIGVQLDDGRRAMKTLYDHRRGASQR